MRIVVETGRSGRQHEKHGLASSRGIPQQIFGDRVFLRRISADNEHTFFAKHLIKRAAGIACQDGGKRIEGRGPARRAVNVVGEEDGPQQLLELIEHFVGQAWRDNSTNRLAFDLSQPLAQIASCLVPGDRHEDALMADHWPSDPILSFDEVEAEAAARAERFAVDAMFLLERTRINSPLRAPTVSWQPVPQCGQTVSVSARSQGRAFVSIGKAHQCTDRADLDAVAALVATGKAPSNPVTAVSMPFSIVPSATAPTTSSHIRTQR